MTIAIGTCNVVGYVKHLRVRNMKTYRFQGKNYTLEELQVLPEFLAVGRKSMRLTSQDESRIIVTVKQAKRDDAKTVIETGVDGKKKEVANKMYGKIIYETVESIDVYEAQGEQVVAAVKAGLENAARNGGRK